MKSVNDIANDFYESIDAFKVEEYDKFIESLNYFDNLNYKTINLKYVLPPFIEQYKSEIDNTSDEEKKYKIVVSYLTFVTEYLHKKNKYKERQKIDIIKRKAIRKANDVYFKAIDELKVMQSEEYSYVKEKDINDLVKLTKVLLNSPLNKIENNPTKANIDEIIKRLFGKTRKAKKLKDIVK